MGAHQSSAIAQIYQSSPINKISESSAITKTALGKVNLPEISRLSSCLTRKCGDNDAENELRKKVMFDIKEARNKIIKNWKERKSFNFIKALIIMRPISSAALSRLTPNNNNNNNNNEDEISNVSLAAFGMFHTMILLRSNENDFILDRCVEGIRLYNLNYDQLDQNTSCILSKCFEHKQPISLIIFGEYDICLNCYNLANWIEEESKIEYNLLLKNCIHFGYDFASKFTKEKKVTFARFWKRLSTKFWQLSSKLHNDFQNMQKYRQEHGLGNDLFAWDWDWDWEALRS